MADETARELFPREGSQSRAANHSPPTHRSSVLRMTPSRSLRMSSLMAGSNAMRSVATHQAHQSSQVISIPDQTLVRSLQPADTVTSPQPRVAESQAANLEDSFFDDIDPSNVDLRLTGRNFSANNPVNSTATSGTAMVAQRTRPDYHSMTVKQLREECSRLGVVNVGKDNRPNRIAALELYDRTFGKDGNSPEPKRTKHCAFRLINFVTSTKFSARFADIGDVLSRGQLDVGARSARMQFWNELAEAYRQDDEEYRHLKHPHRLFSSSKIDPSVIRNHSGEKLLGIWKELNGKYKNAVANSKQSGNHSSDFEDYGHGNAGVLYLWMCLQDKPNLTSFVLGGVFEDDEVDTIRAQLHPNRGNNHVRTPPKTKKRYASKTTPTPRKSPRTQRQNQQKQQDEFQDTVHDVIRSVTSFLNHVRPDSQSSTTSTTTYKELDLVHDRIIAIQTQIETASSTVKQHLENDRTYYIRRRDRLRKKLEEEDEDSDED